MSVAQAMARARELADQMDTMPSVTVSRYFAGAALRAGRVQFGFVMKGVLYLRVDDASRPAFEAAGAAPFTYAGAGKDVTVATYYEAPSEVLEDPQALSRWAARALRAAVGGSDAGRSSMSDDCAGAWT